MLSMLTARYFFLFSNESYHKIVVRSIANTVEKNIKNKEKEKNLLKT